MDVLLTASTWRGYAQADFPAASWHAQDDVLHALPDGPRVSLVSQEEFADFDLSFEWRLPVGGNSGVLFHVTEEEDEPWKSGPEFQLLDNANHEDGRTPETSCGALYGIQGPTDAPPCSPGLYNISRIRVSGAHVQYWLNGVRVLDCDMKSDDFRERIARSKFSRLPRFAAARQGRIALQHHGTDAWFRNLRIERL